MSQDNRGITMVEMLVAITMSLIILGAAALLLRTAQNDYQNTSESVNLQSESQVLMEQLGMWIMEGNRVQVSGSELTIYRIPRKITTELPSGVTPSSDKASKRIIWLSGNKLYMKVIENISDPDMDTTTVTTADEIEENCIGEYVTGFVPAVDASAPSKVCLDLTLEQGRQKYKVSNVINVRNELV